MFLPTKITDFDETKTSHSTRGRPAVQAKCLYLNKRQLSKTATEGNK